MTIKKEIRNDLQKKLSNITNRRINQIIKKIQNEHGLIDRDDAVYILAYEQGINLIKYLGKEEIRRIQGLITNSSRVNQPSKLKTSGLVEKNNVTEKSPYDYLLSKFNIDSELMKDCKIQPPYRNAVTEAMLTLETRIRDTLSLSADYIGEKLIQEARKEVFERKVKNEEEGLYFLFMGAFKWIRNPNSHRKIIYTKENSIKMILFVDYLIKLFDDLVNKRI